MSRTISPSAGDSLLANTMALAGATPVPHAAGKLPAQFAPQAGEDAMQQRGIGQAGEMPAFFAATARKVAGQGKLRRRKLRAQLLAPFAAGLPSVARRRLTISKPAGSGSASSLDRSAAFLVRTSA